jgi:hypothetical protein
MRRPTAVTSSSLDEAPDTAPERAIALLATAIPSATLNVAIHVVHALPDGACEAHRRALSTAETNAARGLQRCRRALPSPAPSGGTAPPMRRLGSRR